MSYLLNNNKIHLPSFRFDNSIELQSLYAQRFFMDLIAKMMGFFVPLFLYKLSGQINFFDRFGFSQLQLGIFFIASYYLFVRVVTFFSSIPVGKIIAKMGSRLTLLLAVLSQAIWLLSFHYSQFNPSLVYLAGFASGLHISFFYNTFYTLLSRSSQKRHTGENLSVIQLFVQLISVVAPAIGGFIIVNFGFSTLFLVAFVAVIIDLIIVISMKTHVFRRSPNIKEMMRWFHEKQFQKLALSYAGKYLNDGVMVVWPVYVFLILGSIEKVGYLYSLSLLLASLIIIFTGFYVDHSKSKKPFFLSGSLISLVWILRTQIISIWSIAVVDTLDKLAGSFHWLYFDSMFIKRAKGGGDLCFFVYREMIISAVAIIFWLFLIGLFWMAFDWISLFLVAAAGTLLTLFISDHYEQPE